MSRGGIRLIAGRWRGHRLEVPPGIRPSEARVREALFSIWGPRLADARILDLFAGSGAVGLEALGRGAAHVVLVDGGRASLRALERNCRVLAGGQPLAGATVLSGRLPCALAVVAGAPCDLIFADPPYAFDDYGGLLEEAIPWLVPDGELVIEHSSRVALPAPDPWRSSGQRRYGETCLSFYAKVESEKLCPKR